MLATNIIIDSLCRAITLLLSKSRSSSDAAEQSRYRQKRRKRSTQNLVKWSMYARAQKMGFLWLCASYQWYNVSVWIINLVAVCSLVIVSELSASTCSDLTVSSRRGGEQQGNLAHIVYGSLMMEKVKLVTAKINHYYYLSFIYRKHLFLSHTCVLFC